jgi:hypothetical protein
MYGSRRRHGWRRLGRGGWPSPNRPAVLPGPWPPVVYYQTGPGPASADGRTVVVSGRMTIDPYAESLLLAHLPPARFRTLVGQPPGRYRHAAARALR